MARRGTRARFVRSRAALLLGAATLALGGCASNNLAFGLTEDEMPGIWTTSGPGPQAILDIRNDGTFLASNWPANLFCQGEWAASTDELNWRHTLEFYGEWWFSDGNLSHTVSFIFPDDTCQGDLAGGFPGHVFRDSSSGQLSLEAYLVHIDLATADETVVLVKE